MLKSSSFGCWFGRVAAVAAVAVVVVVVVAALESARLFFFLFFSFFQRRRELVWKNLKKKTFVCSALAWWKKNFVSVRSNCSGRAVC